MFNIPSIQAHLETLTASQDIKPEGHDVGDWQDGGLLKRWPTQRASTETNYNYQKSNVGPVCMVATFNGNVTNEALKQ